MRFIKELFESGIDVTVDRDGFRNGIEQPQTVDPRSVCDGVEFVVSGDVLTADLSKGDAKFRDAAEQLGLCGAVTQCIHVDEGVNTDNVHD